MARTAAALKNTAMSVNHGDKEVVAPENKTKSHAAGVKLIQTAVIAVRATYQSIVEAEPKINEAALFAVRHANQHGDVSLADRLVKDMRAAMPKDKTHPTIEAMFNELMAWFRANSPIRWDAKQHCTIDKERGWKDKDLKNAEETGFFETERATKARDAMLRTQVRELHELTLERILNDALGLNRKLEAALKPNKDGQIAGVKKGEAKPIRDFVGAVAELVEQYQKKIKVEKKVA